MKDSILKLTGTLLLFAYLLLTVSFVFYKFWYWFINPLFDTINLTYIQCIGLIMTISFLQLKVVKDLKDEFYKDSIKDVYAVKIVTPWVYLLLGYIVYLFIIKP